MPVLGAALCAHCPEPLVLGEFLGVPAWMHHVPGLKPYRHCRLTVATPREDPR